MKVEFLSAVRSTPRNRTTSLSRTRTSTSVNNSEPLGPIVRISFKGNEKNYAQFASIAPEDKGMGIPEYNRGGLAVVAQEAPDSWAKNLKADVRTFLPYHSYNNPNGGIKVLKVPYGQDGKPLTSADPSLFKTKPVDYVLEDGEKFVIQSAPNGGKSKYVVLERLDDIKGSVSRISDRALKEETIGYQLFKAILPNKGKGVTRYIMHTQEMAKFPQAYDGNSGAYGAYGAYSNKGVAGAYSTGAYHAGTSDGFYADNARAIADALPKLNTEKHGFYNPANIWAHDRVAFPIINEVANRSAAGNKYYNGLRMHGTYHNPGRAYQGVYDDALQFLRIVGSSNDDLKAIQSHPAYDRIKEIDEKRLKGTVTKEEIQEASELLDPILGRFKDSKGTYNLTKIPLVSTMVNPHNTSSGTVSQYYGKEMMNHNSYDIAGGLTDDFASVRTINITNGSTPANLRIDDESANFGRGNNGLTANKAGFTTYKPVIENGEIKNIDEILKAKENNKRWLLDLIGNADKGDGKLERLFFSEEQLSGKRPSSVVGQLSPYQEGDRLFMGWGRPDPQKGFPTTFEGFLKYLQDPTVSEETKKHTKLIVGAGADTWQKDARDWKNIQKLIDKIQKLDNGKYRGNVMYVNGLFPNRLVACADFSCFTSVFEPCGITPFESFSSGTPVISTNTGGAGEFVFNYDATKGAVNSETGFLTEGPYLRNPEALGITQEQLKDDKTAFRIVDDARRAKTSDEVAECFKQAVSLDTKNYRQMSINAFLQKVDWHENAAYNGGVSANTRYMRDCFQIDELTFKPISGLERNTNPLKRLLGSFNEVAQKTQMRVIESIDSAKATKVGKVITGVGILLVAAGTGAMVYLNNKKAKNKENKTVYPSFRTNTPQPLNNYNKPTTFSKFG